MSILEEETKRADQALLDQYRSELDQLRRGKGVARTMSKSQISVAKAQLTAAIRGFKGYLY